MSRYPSNGPSMSGVRPFRVYTFGNHRRSSRPRGRTWDWVRTGEDLKIWEKEQRLKNKRKSLRIKAQKERERITMVEKSRLAVIKRKKDAIDKQKRLARQARERAIKAKQKKLLHKKRKNSSLLKAKQAEAKRKKIRLDNSLRKYAEQKRIIREKVKRKKDARTREKANDPWMDAIKRLNAKLSAGEQVAASE